uniref:Uncharacterized protein n=1 Tax=Acrobeloides nanus TaxID=290746 RepID=A0A914EHZ3_9BILA
MKNLIIFSSLLIISIKLASGGFFDDIVSSVKSAGETIGDGAVSAYNWTTQEAAPVVGETLVNAGEAVGTGAVKAYNWTTEFIQEAAPKVGETAEEAYKEASQALG